MKAPANLFAGALLLSVVQPPLQPAPAPPPVVPSLSSPAPVPDIDAPIPSRQTDNNYDPRLRPGLSRPGTGPTADNQGFTPGSSYSETQDARRRLTPTLDLSVPLQ